MQFYLETERLIMRELRIDDLEGMFALDSDPLVHQYLGNKPITHRSQAEKYIAFICQQYVDHGIGRFATIEKKSGDFIGWSGIKFNTGKKEAIGKYRDFYDIGYRFMPKYWGNGYATESSVKILEFGFNQLNISKMCGAAEVVNIASNKVLKKIGLNFIEEFYMDDDYGLINWYELTKEEYAAKKMS